MNLGSPSNAVLGSPTSFTLAIEDNELPPCEVGSHLLTVGTDSIDLSMVNEGETVRYTGGSITWIKVTGTEPHLTTVNFAGTTVFNGIENPTSHLFTAWEEFYTLTTESIEFEFDGPLGTGEHVIVSNFQNPNTGTTCSVTEIFTKH